MNTPLEDRLRHALHRVADTLDDDPLELHHPAGVSGAVRTSGPGRSARWAWVAVAAAAAVVVGIGVAAQGSRTVQPAAPPASTWPTEISPPPTTSLDPSALALGAPVRVPTPYVDISTASTPVLVTREGRRPPPEGTELEYLTAVADGLLAVRSHAGLTELVHVTDGGETTTFVSSPQDTPPGESPGLSYLSGPDGRWIAFTRRSDGGVPSLGGFIDLTVPDVRPFIGAAASPVIC